MFYQVLGSLGAEGGPWDAEMQGIFPPMWESRPRGTYLHTKRSVLEGFLANKMHRMHGEHVLDVLSSAGHVKKSDLQRPQQAAQPCMLK